MITADSRYATGDLTTVTLPDGSGNVMLTPAPVNLAGIAFFYYTVQGGDRIDVLAAQYLGDAAKWWTIIDMNPEVLWPTDLIPGDVLRMPMVAPVSTNVPVGGVNG